MADIELESGTITTRTFTLEDASGTAVDITGMTVTVRIRELNAESPFIVAACTLVTPADGIISYTFRVSPTTWAAGSTYVVRFVADDNGTLTRYPDGAPLTAYVWART